MEKWHWGLASKRWGKFQSEGWQPVVEGGFPGWGSSVSRLGVRVCSGSSQPSVVGAGGTWKNGGWGCYLNVPVCVTGVIRASSFPVLSRPRDFSDLPTSAVSVFKHNRDGTIFSTKDHIGITPSAFFFFSTIMSHPMWKFWNDPLVENHCHRKPLFLRDCHIPQVCCGSQQRLRTWSWV